jgi:transcriptional regulator with GAF, ATPase, and Fis domain
VKQLSNEEDLFADPRRLLLDMAKLRNTADLLTLVVDRLVESPNVALARIWLQRPGDICATCPMREECPDQTACLHLVVSGGNSHTTPAADYSGIEGAFRRFPLGVRKVGRIATTREAIEVPDTTIEPYWLVDPGWVRREGIRGFGGQPLVASDEVFGVLAVFSRIPLGATNLEWLRTIADSAATALANARAWEEIGALRRQLALENEYLREEVGATQSFGGMVGQSAALMAVTRQIEVVAPTDATVLVMGETGTGKELVAREIHRRSGRAARPLIKVNCAAIPRELYDSEFFGHVKGSFTGALRDRIGRFELADGGTLFLDEISEIPLDLQSKLLRALQEGEVERVGEERVRKIDVRIIAATNRALRAESDAGRFRNDLYYRLSVFPINVPPLRHRKEDIALLTEHFLTHLSRRLGRPTPRLTIANFKQLEHHDWPGNIRELQHMLERAIIASPDGKLRLEIDHARPNAPSAAAATGTPRSEILTAAQFRTMETANIRRALAEANGRIYGAAGAAAMLGLKPTTLMSRLKSLGIKTSTMHSRE